MSDASLMVNPHDRMDAATDRGGAGPSGPAAEIAFLTSHGRVLVYFATRPEATPRHVAAALGLSERTVGRVIRDLRAAGWIDVEATRSGYRYLARRGR